jgi:hypothetical protein
MVDGMKLNFARQRGRRSSFASDLSTETFYTVWVRWPGETRLQSIEREMIESEDEAISVLREIPAVAVVFVFRHDPDVPRRDVSEDLARRWLRERTNRGYDPVTLPDFIAQHLSSDDIADITYNPWSLAAE